jgi:hypothetical protein
MADMVGHGRPFDHSSRGWTCAPPVILRSQALVDRGGWPYDRLARGTRESSMANLTTIIVRRVGAMGLPPC